MRVLVTLAACSLLAAPAWAQQQQRPAADVPEAPIQLAQADFHDPDVDNEETLEDLQAEEYDKEAWSVGKAIGLSFIPGGGWGLLYADKKAAAAVPFTLSIAGFALGGVYMAGVFDESKGSACRNSNNDEIVADRLCTFPSGQTPPTDQGLSDDERRNIVNGVYQGFETGEDFDGTNTGILIMGATYAATTLLGAVWAGMSVADHNEQLRKDIESTAGVPRPVLGFSGDRGYVGLTLDF